MFRRLNSDISWTNGSVRGRSKRKWRAINTNILFNNIINNVEFIYNLSLSDIHFSSIIYKINHTRCKHYVLEKMKKTKSKIYRTAEMIFNFFFFKENKNRNQNPNKKQHRIKQK